MRSFMKQARKEKKITLRELGEIINASHCFLSQIENGKRNPSPKLAQKIAKELKIDWTAFFNEAA